MEILALEDKTTKSLDETVVGKPFIVANTIQSSIAEIKNNHLIPVRTSVRATYWKS